MDLRPIRVVHYGLGAIGRDIARLIAQQPGMQIVGGIDTSPEKAGHDVGEVIGLDRSLNAPISADPAALLKQTAPDIVVHATTSRLHDVYPQLIACIQARADVISTCEELVYPYVNNAAPAAEIHRLALASGVTVLGAGVNPGFVMDLLPLVLTATCSDVRRVSVTRAVDATDRRSQVQQRIGAGLSLDQFRAHLSQGAVRHVGLSESIQMLAAGLGMRIERYSETIDPIIAEDWVRTKHMVVAPGQVAGIRQVAQAWQHGRDVLSLTWETSMGASQTYDAIVIDGTPPIDVIIRGGLHGDQAAAALIMHALPQLLHAASGLITVLDLPPIHYQPSSAPLLRRTP